MTLNNAKNLILPNFYLASIFPSENDFQIRKDKQIMLGDY